MCAILCMVVICWLLLNAVILFSWWGQDFFFFCRKKTTVPFDLQVDHLSMHKQQSQYSICKTRKKVHYYIFIKLVYTMYLYRILFHALNNAYPTFFSSWNISSFYSYWCCEQITDFSLRFPQNNHRNAKTMMSQLVNRRRNSKGKVWPGQAFLFYSLPYIVYTVLVKYHQTMSFGGKTPK